MVVALARHRAPALLVVAAGLAAIAGGLGWRGPGHPAALEATTIAATGVPFGTPAGQLYSGRLGTFTDAVVNREDVFRVGAYREVLRREPAGAELAAFLAPLATTAQREAFAFSLFGTAEYRALFVRDLVEGLFGRPPTPAETATYGAAFEAEGSSGALASLLASQEYFNSAGGDPSAWLLAAYQDVLNREPSPAETAAQLPQATAGSAARRGLASTLLASAEYRQARLHDLFRQVLGRDADAPGLASYLAILTSSGRWHSVIAAMMGSSEYFERFPAPAYTIAIAWGDGAESTGTVHSTASPGAFEVTGAHAFASPGSYQVTARIDTNYGASASFTARADVAPAAGTAPPPPPADGDGPGPQRPAATPSPTVAATPSPTRTPGSAATPAPSATPLLPTPAATSAITQTASGPTVAPPAPIAPAPPGAGSGQRGRGPVPWAVVVAGCVAMAGGLGAAAFRLSRASRDT